MPLFGSLVAYLPTPRTASGELAPDALATLVGRAVDAGVSGVAVLGSTGGFPYLDAAARQQTVRTAVDAAAGRIPVLAGVGALTTAQAHAHVVDAQQAGAAAVLLPTMSYLPLTDDEVVGLVRAVADRADVPVWIYHNPVSTSFSYSVETLGRVAALPGVGGVKDRGSDVDDLRARVPRVRAALPPGVEVGYSGDVLGVEALLAGADTWHSGLAGVLPGWYVAVADAAARGRADDARALMDRLAVVARLVVAGGGPRAVHAVARLTGVEAGELPAPLRPVGPAVVEALERAMAELGAAPRVP